MKDKSLPAHSIEFVEDLQRSIEAKEMKIQQLEAIIKNRELLIFELKGQIRNLEDTLGIEYNGS